MSYLKRQTKISCMFMSDKVSTNLGHTILSLTNNKFTSDFFIYSSICIRIESYIRLIFIFMKSKGEHITLINSSQTRRQSCPVKGNITCCSY